MFVFELLRTKTPLYTDVIAIVMAFLESNRDELKLTHKKCAERTAATYNCLGLFRYMLRKNSLPIVLRLLNKRDEERALMFRRHLKYGCYDRVGNYMLSLRKHHAQCMLLEHLCMTEHLSMTTNWYLAHTP